jgi:hypothetical protein
MRALHFKIFFLTLLMVVFTLQFAAAKNSGNRFRPSGPVASGGEENDDLRTPLDFEKALAEKPLHDSQILFSQCRFAPFSGDPNFYSALSGDISDAIVGDTEFFFSDGVTHCYNPQNESNIVVNPTDSDNLVTSANEYRIDGHAVYVSTDGGESWTNVALPGWTSSTGGKGIFSMMSSCGDPVLAFGPDGTLYYSGIFCTNSPIATVSGIAVAKSYDGGAHWTYPVKVTYNNAWTIFNDKPWTTVGPDGAVYVTWTRFKVAKNAYFESPIVVSKSTDGGNTWSDWVMVSDRSHPFNQGSVPVVAPDGTLYVAYEGSTPSTDFNGDAIILARSTDGGSTFTNTELARAYDDSNCYPHNVAQGRQTLSGEEFRINSFPSFAIDPSNGHMAIVWADDEANASCGYEKGGSFVGPTSNQVKLITSTDGTTWSSPTVITTGAADKVYPSVGANDGRISVGYYTRAYSPTSDDCRAATLDTVTMDITYFGGPVCLDYAQLASDDSFASENRLTTDSSNPYLEFAGSFIGDYTGGVVDGDGNAAHVWTDDRGNPDVTDPNQDVHVAHHQ